MAVAHVTGPVPGPNSRALLERQSRVVSAGLSTVHPVFIAHASGATLTDVDGNTFLDFAGGIGVMNVGHTHPAVVDAIVSAARMVTHSAFQVCGYEGYIAVAERLCAM